MRRVTCLATLGLAACGGGGGYSSSSAPPAANQSLSGIWEGMDSDGDEIYGLVTESGAFHLIDQFGQGVGTAVVRNGNQVSASYAFLANLGTTLPDGSSSETCSATGTVVERQSLTVAVNCLTDQGTAIQVSAKLTYNPLFDRSASLATIEGMYDDDGNVLTIDSAGVLFEQDVTTGCTLNGQVAVIEPSHNAYAVEFDVDCMSAANELDETTWSGVATLDDSNAPEELIIVVIGDVMVSGDTATFAIARIATRI